MMPRALPLACARLPLLREEREQARCLARRIAGLFPRRWPMHRQSSGAAAYSEIS